MKPRVSVEEVERRLHAKYGDLIQIQRETFVDTHKPAIFIDKEFGAWRAVVKDVCSGHLSRKRRAAEARGKRPNFTPEGLKRLTGRPSRYTVHDIVEAASQCQTMSEFKTRFPQQFNACANRGWKAEVYKVLPKRPKLLYSIDEITTIALQYETRTKFYKGDAGAYAAAIRLRVLDNVCQHMRVPFERRDVNGLKSVYRISFDDGAVYIGLSIYPYKRLDQHLQAEGVVLRHVRKTGQIPKLEILHKDLNGPSASKMEAAEVDKHKKSGCIVLNKAKAGSHGGSKTYSDCEIIRIAQRYSTISEWASNHGGSYNSAKKRGIQAQCTSHMKTLKRKWSLELAMEEGKKYSSRKDWQAHSNRSYVLVAKAGRLDEVIPSQLKKWDKESALAEKAKYKTHGQWSRSSPGSYNYWNKNIRN